MAGAEVIVSSGDLMTVKAEEGESSGDNHKAQVILHLQPVLQGLTDDTVEAGTTVLAIETHRDDSKAEGEEIEYGYPITCGDSRAVLLFKKFVCPGINVRCVKFNDQLISPKQFVHLAGKATLKDWKRAIRLGGVMLRKMMDSGQIDFYQHDTVCSNTCRSTKFDVLIGNARIPTGAPVQPSPSCLVLDPLGGHMPPLTGEVAHEVQTSLEDKFSSAAEWSAGPTTNPTTTNGHATKRKRPDVPDGLLSLWKSVAASGLMGDVLSSLQTELLAMFKGVENRTEKANLQEADAVLLHSLCKMFGLLDSVKQAVELKRSHNEDGQNRSQSHDYVLDEILEDQRTKSRDKSSSCKVKSLKHLRAQCHRSPPCAVKPVSVVQHLSIAGGSPYARLNINPQLFTSCSASNGQRHHARGSRRNKGQHDGVLERELGQMVDQEKITRPKQEALGSLREPADRTVEEPHYRVTEAERVVLGRKKHKNSVGEFSLRPQISNSYKLPEIQAAEPQF
ncbi:hypothetical protein fugu_009892 [Takifugu bimaculatus]|uniref:SAND domain-containing protein n=1 Tax=Takifugu bimaculatus TaxID=433685 RepID=A0A4Z2CE23_9TELE|nr:hypothetical protein fugu_009892 [Takifugu bimaculatus]